MDDRLKSIHTNASASEDKTVPLLQRLQHDCTYMEGHLAPARKFTVRLGMVVFCVHVNVHLHFIIQDLHELLHGGQVT